ncbi:MAG: hypothetical protein ACHRXM_18605 [Isosphaerales bacterium]
MTSRDEERVVRTIPLLLISHRLKTTGAGVLAVVAGLLAWLWPIGIGGKMPVGGDVTQFFLGVMGVLSESLREGRLAVWNDLWGYGFPGLAESQMGVYYPVHVILYRWLTTETAYVVSLVLHTLWGGLGTFWAARRLGISSAGAALSAFSWSACGFFLIHLAHPWGYTTGCWMPWAWGLAWCMLAGGAAGPARPLLLSLVLVLQVLPGHFQLAFLTHAGIVLMIFWTAVESWGVLGLGRLRTAPAGPALSVRGAGGVVLALAAVFPLAAMQLWPTARLAQMAAGQRDFEYLSGFASPPFHLVNYVAPGLFHRSPLWRPLVWDPFHAMPEEHLAYVGLVPLFLACTTMVREWRRDASVRLLAILVVVTLVLSLGPYAPGFRYLIMLPGFSFFRAPSRWSLATALALALLAGKGFDRWPEWTLSTRSLRRFAFIALIWVLAIVGLLELALSSTARPGWARVARGFQTAFAAMPWTGDPSFEAVLGLARRPLTDQRFPPGRPQSGRTFANERGRIYAAELWESAFLVMGLVIVAWRSETGRHRAGTVKGALVLITFLDLLALGRHRLIGVGPWRPLTEQSPVLARLAEEPRGTRIANGRLRNMPMLLGMAPISAYRTLDLPAVPSLTALAQELLGDDRYESNVLEALRATGTGVRVFDPLENRMEQLLRRTVAPRETIEDAALASWLLDASWVAEQGSWARKFTIWRSGQRPARAWLVRKGEVPEPGVLDEWSGDPREILAILRGAQPLASTSSRPEEWTISVTADEPAWVIVSQLADPQWRARWVDRDGPWANEKEILPTFRKRGEAGGWQRIAVPAPGRWTLRLEYDARDVAMGLAISTVAWMAWMTAAVFVGFRAARAEFVPRRGETEA